MATNVHTSSYTVAAIRRRGLIPTGRIADADLLKFADDATQDYVVPILMAAREGFLLYTSDTALTTATAYPFPVRAASERLERVLLVDGAGNELPLDRVEVGRKELGQSGYELIDNVITLVNMPSGYTSLRVTYFRKPNRLVTEAEAPRITVVGATTITVGSVPATFGTSEPLDFIAGTPGFRLRSMDATPTNVNTGTGVITFASGVLPAALAVGDYVALAGETPIVQVPEALHPLVEQAAVVMALEALGDKRSVVAQQTLDRMEKRLIPTLAPRVPGSPRVIVNRYSMGSALRRVPGALRRWW